MAKGLRASQDGAVVGVESDVESACRQVHPPRLGEDDGVVRRTGAPGQDGQQEEQEGRRAAEGAADAGIREGHQEEGQWEALRQKNEEVAADERDDQLPVECAQPDLQVEVGPVQGPREVEQDLRGHLEPPGDGQSEGEPREAAAAKRVKNAAKGREKGSAVREEK